MTRQQAREEARRLVVAEGSTYAQAAAAVGVPVSTIQKWASAEEWQSQRGTTASYDSQMRAIKRAVQDRVAGAIEGEAGIGQISQLIMALEKLERAYPEHRYTPPARDPRARLEVGIAVVEELVTWLSGCDRSALAALQPHISAFSTHLEERWAA